MKKRPILVAIDLSEVSVVVLKAACVQAKKAGRPLKIVHIMEQLGGDDSKLLLPVIRGWVEKAKQEARIHFEKVLRKNIPANEVEYTSEILEGPAAEEIVIAARRERSPLIIVGAPHPGGRLAATLGRVMRGSRVPVLIVRRPPESPYMKVVMGVDLGSASCDTSKTAALVASPNASHIAVNILQTPRFYKPNEGEGAALAHQRGLLEEWVARHDFTDIELVVEKGDPKKVLIDEALINEADLLAVGRHYGANIVKFFLGSVAKEAAHKAPCDVIVCTTRPRARKIIS